MEVERFAQIFLSGFYPFFQFSLVLFISNVRLIRYDLTLIFSKCLLNNQWLSGYVFWEGMASSETSVYPAGSKDSLTGW